MKTLADQTGPPIFRPFNPEGELRVYYRNLPHWRQPGATYFVTFRLADSIPKSALAKWLDIKVRWFRAHNIPLDWLNERPERLGEAYRRVPRQQRLDLEQMQFRMLHQQLDLCHGSCVLRDEKWREIVEQSLLHFHGSRLWVGDFTIMPNHVHALLQPFDGWELEELLGSVKKWTSRRIRTGLRQVDREHPILSLDRMWQSESYDRIVRDPEERDAYRKYTASDPGRTGLPPNQFTHHRADWLDVSVEYD